LAEGGGEAAQLQVGAAAREQQELGSHLNGPEQHENVVVGAKALQPWRLRVLHSVTDVGRENAGDGLVEVGVCNALPNRVAEVQRLALPAAEFDVTAAVLRRAQPQLPHELGQVLRCNDVSSCNLPSENKEAYVNERAVLKRGVERWS
jgi:hypothetical protein